MKKLILLFSVLFLFSCAHHDPWSRADIAREGVVLGLKFVDWGQTRTIANNPDRFYELNPILGKHPNESEVDLYFLSTAVLHVTIAHFLPKEYRKWWQYSFIGLSSACVINNSGEGIKLFD